MDRFAGGFDVRALTARDLLEARDAFHAHLSSLENVVGTAVGYDLFHPDAPAGSSDREKPLHEAVVTPASLPAVLVFVKRWRSREALGRTPEQYIPPRLHMPDGRVVPTCVVSVESEPTAPPAPAQTRVKYPGRLMGGGYPCLVERQGQTRLGTVGCLVTDGTRTYALTNSHVAGDAGEEVYTQVKNRRIRIGRSTGKVIAKRPFAEIYPGAHDPRAVSNLDVGLIDLDNKHLWTAQVFGVGVIGEPVDLRAEALDLDLIGCPVVAHGGATGLMRGLVKCLFYRYRSLGGFDVVADVLIAPAPGSTWTQTRAGDSGTIWFYDRSAEAERAERADAGAEPRPLAVQWGGHGVLAGAEGRTYRFALAGSLATALRLLGVEIVRDWDIGLPEYWGKLGHFAMAQRAVALIAPGPLRAFMEANLDAITCRVQGYSPSDVPTFDHQGFVPLVDVPELVWKSKVATMGRRWETGNHYINLDQAGAGPEFGGETLMSLWSRSRTLDPELWTRFYDALGIDDEMRGALPIRIWQAFDEMVAALRSGAPDRYARFLALAGVFAHYAADAFMPLHNTVLHHGYPGASEEARQVHGYIDNTFLSIRQGGLLQRAFSRASAASPVAPIPDGAAAGALVMDKMIEKYAALPPATIIDAFNATLGWPWQRRYASLMDRIGEAVAAAIADGTVWLATLWESAWRAGHDAGAEPAPPLAPIPFAELSRLYLDAEGFLPCRPLRARALATGGSPAM